LLLFHIVWLVGIESVACIHPPSEDDAPPGVYQAVAQNINIHTAGQIVVSVFAVSVAIAIAIAIAIAVAMILLLLFHI
jgi:hypothetical protein